MSDFSVFLTSVFCPLNSFGDGFFELPTVTLQRYSRANKRSSSIFKTAKKLLVLSIAHWLQDAFFSYAKMKLLLWCRPPPFISTPSRIGLVRDSSLVI